MFSWRKKRKPDLTANPDAVNASLKPGERFRWPLGVTVTATDDVVLAIPLGLIESHTPMSQFISAPDDMQINIAEAEDRIYLKLDIGMSVRLAKTVECLVCGEDQKPRRIHLEKPKTKA